MCGGGGGTVHGLLNGPVSFRGLNAEICILPHPEKPSEGDDAEEEAGTAEGSSSSKDPNSCTDAEVLTSVDACRETYQDAVRNQSLCM